MSEPEGSPAISDEDIFAEACELPAGPDRDRYLDAACGSETPRRRQIEQLIALEEKDDAFLEPRHHTWNRLVGDAIREVADNPGKAPPMAKPGDQVGPFTIDQPIGAGGFGVVYRAKQNSPVRRIAAVKLLRPGLDTLEILRRFDRERETLSRLRHPGIAGFYDAGSTENGRPWIAMELVEGLPLHQFCDEHRLTIKERLHLFQQVCRAVHHAHLRGIIHRDLKPSNLLVTETEDGPTPKVIDFGVARCLDPESDDEFRTLVTVAGQLIGTPAYMSPEQAGLTGHEIDPRTDVYSLGAILYELLTGELPLGEPTRTRLSATALEKILREQEPSRPSQRITTELQASRRSLANPGSAASQLRGDLDWIVLKALEKDPERRYESATALADDIQAHLEQRPVIARPPSFAYLAGRFARRHRAAVAAGGIVLVSILAALAFSTAMYFREAKARQIAEIETKRSRQISRFLEDALTAAGPSVALGRDTTLMREILEKTSTRIDEELGHDPEIESELRAILGRTWGELKQFDRSISQHALALERRRDLHRGDHPDLATSLIDYATALEDAGRPKEAESFAREGLAMRERLLDSDDPLLGEALSQLAFILLKSGKPREGEPFALRSVEIWRNQSTHHRNRDALLTLAMIYQASGRRDLALDLYREELETFRSIHNGAHPAIVNSLDNFGYTLAGAGRDEEAEPILLEGLAMGREVFGDSSPHEDHILGALARIAGRRGDLDQQLAYAREGAETGARVYPEGHRYWRESQRQYLDTLIGQVERFLDQSGKGDLEPSLNLARDRLTELRSTPSLEKVQQPGDRAWITWLETALASREAGRPTTEWERADRSWSNLPIEKTGKKYRESRSRFADRFRDRLDPTSSSDLEG